MMYVCETATVTDRQILGLPVVILSCLKNRGVSQRSYLLIPAGWARARDTDCFCDSLPCDAFFCCCIKSQRFHWLCCAPRHFDNKDNFFTLHPVVHYFLRIGLYFLVFPTFGEFFKWLSWCFLKNIFFFSPLQQLQVIPAEIKIHYSFENVKWQWHYNESNSSYSLSWLTSRRKWSVTLAAINCLKEYAQPLLLLFQEHFLIIPLWNYNLVNCVLYFRPPTIIVLTFINWQRCINTFILRKIIALV